MPGNEHCGGCYFWGKLGNDAGEHHGHVAFGECRRFPPVIQEIAENQQDPDIWLPPVTTADNWCGEYKAAPAAVEGMADG